MKATEAKLLEFLKKATQFVIPIYQRTYSWGQAKRLRLSLNLAFPEMNDPRGICKDVTGLGRWGYRV